MRMTRTITSPQVFHISKFMIVIVSVIVSQWSGRILLCYLLKLLHLVQCYMLKLVMIPLQISFPSSPMNVVVKTPPVYPGLRTFCIFRHLNLGENRLNQLNNSDKLWKRSFLMVCFSLHKFQVRVQTVNPWCMLQIRSESLRSFSLCKGDYLWCKALAAWTKMWSKITNSPLPHAHQMSTSLTHPNRTYNFCELQIWSPQITPRPT